MLTFYQALKDINMLGIVDLHELPELKKNHNSIHPARDAVVMHATGGIEKFFTDAYRQTSCGFVFFLCFFPSSESNKKLDFILQMFG